MSVKINNVNYNTIPEQVVLNKTAIGELDTRVTALENQGGGFSVDNMRVKLKSNDAIDFTSIGMTYSNNKWLLLSDLSFSVGEGENYSIPKGELVQFIYNGQDEKWKIKSTAQYMDTNGTMKEFELDVTGKSIAFTGTILQFLAS
jgi:hypothetical protein